MIGLAGEVILIDFDSCLPFGERVVKGGTMTTDPKALPVSKRENDLEELMYLRDFLLEA